MARKKSGEENNSLELLLDTMCNTFGGVMFIAISLVVISSLIPKIISEEELEDQQAPEEIDIRQINIIKKRVDRLRKILEKQNEERSLQESIIKKYKNHPNLELLKKLAMLKEENSVLSRQLIDAKTENKQMVIDLRTATKLREIADRRVKSRKGSLEDLKNINLNLKQKITNIKTDIVEQEKTLARRDKRKIGSNPFADTTKKPFFVILKDDKLYRVSNYTQVFLSDGQSLFCSDDVGTNFNRAQAKLHLTPRTGKGIAIAKKLDNTRNLKRVFDPGKVKKSDRFIWIIAKNDSFKGLVILRDFLKEHDYSYYWHPVKDDSEFILTFSRNVKYKGTN